MTRTGQRNCRHSVDSCRAMGRVEREAGPAPLVHRLAPESPRAASLPFVAVVEAHMLAGFRELGLSPAELRKSVTRIRRELSDEYAIATRRVATDGVSLLIDRKSGGSQLTGSAC